jgi:3-carboxy-cis,cis-muconate cycloisomerase
MLENINLTHGLIFADKATTALAPTMGKLEAHHLLEQLCKQATTEKWNLREILEEENILSLENLESIFNPSNSLGLIQSFIDNVV